MVKVAAISYLNTLPFVYGLENHPVKDEIDLQLNTPSKGAEDIFRGAADVGIIPVVSMLKMPGMQIVSDYCIGAEREVATVLLCSNVPLQRIRTIRLDTESMTSVLLTKVMSRYYWDINPLYESCRYSELNWDETKIVTAGGNGDGYLIIGDKAVENRGRFEYVYDLAAEWRRYLGMPFVFACWITGRSLPERFVKGFNEALGFGIDNIELAVANSDRVINKEKAIAYLRGNISYDLTPDKKKSMEFFLKLAKEVLND